MARECCNHCGCSWLEYVKRKISNGTYQVWIECQGCGKNARGAGILIAHDKMILEDCRTLPSDNLPRCERCDAEGSDWHHWGPRSVFSDADSWPLGRLCLRCHQLWHSKMLAYTNGRVDA